MNRFPARITVALLGLWLCAGWAAEPDAGGPQPACCRTENLVLVTLDGVRWQEVFGGVDRQLASDPDLLFAGQGGVAPLLEALGADSREAARKKLLPFLWGTLAAQGVLLGDRHLGAEFRLANPFHFSYPGYNEMLTGLPDPGIDSNGPLPNPNVTVFEMAGRLPDYTGRIAVFSTWSRFAWILNCARSGIMVNTSGEEMPATSARVALLNELQAVGEGGSWDDNARRDVFTFYQAFEYLRDQRPRVLHIALDETDHFAHAGYYDLYLGALRRSDGLLERLWTWLQADPGYRDRTTLIVTTDHGRGGAENNAWKRHSTKFNEDGSARRVVEGADDVWVAALGPDTKARGAVRHGRLELRQLAPTMAALLGVSYSVEHGDFPTPEPIRLIVSP